MCMTGNKQPKIIIVCIHNYQWIVLQGSAQDYLEVVKKVSDKHTYNIFQSNNNIKCIVVVWSLNDKDH